jgi:hemerythrin superfamily protein
MNSGKEANMLSRLFGKSSTLQDAVDMLIEDHLRVKELFRSYDDVEDSDEAMIGGIVTTSCLELMVHSRLEKEVFYPAIRKVADIELLQLLDEAEVEHATVDALVEELLLSPPGANVYKANFKVVRDYVEHHVKEEEGQMFPKVRRLSLNLDQLAEKMRARQDELIDEIASNSQIASGRGNLSDPRIRTQS